MSTIGKQSGGSAPKASNTSASTSAKKTQKASSVSKTKSQSGAKPAGDKATLSGEKGKAGSVPNFAASFGAKPAATMRTGSQGDDVKALQEALNAKGAKLDADGKYGAKTAQAVRDFQEKMNIKSDGVAGKDTMGKLQAQEADPTKAADPASKAAPATTVDPAAKADPAVKAAPATAVDPATKADPAAKAAPATTVDPAAKADPAVKATPATTVDPAAQAVPAAKATPATTVDPAAKPKAGLDLPAGYESLEKLSGELGKRDPRFNTETADGRSATALALAIGGTEMFGKGKTNTNFFTGRGGTGNNMLGFGQFNQKYHASKTNTPEKYTKFMGDILSGDARMPNSKKGGDHVAALSEAVKSGKIKDGQDLRNFMTQRGFGGSNWQGIDDGWGRNPGLANALVGFLKQGG